MLGDAYWRGEGLYLAVNADNNSLAVDMVHALAVDMVHALLDPGASTGDRTQDGRSTLEIAAATGKVGVLSAMIEHDVDAASFASDPPCATALHYAAASRNPKACDVLVEAGADLAAPADRLE